MISAVLFDLDETLHDRAGSLTSFLCDQHRHWFATRVDLATFVTEFQTLDAHGSLPKSQLYPRLLAVLGIVDLDPESLAEAYDCDFSRHARRMEGAGELLAMLRERGMRLGIVSNGRTEFQNRVIDALGFLDAVDVILISEAEQLRKPDPRLFHRAAARLGVAAEHCLFVGDNPHADILGAMAVGMQAVWFPRGLAWPEGIAAPRRSVAHLSALPALLDAGS